MDRVIEQLKGHLTCHACISGQNALCVRAVVSHFIQSTVVSFFYKNAQPMSSFFLKFCRSLDLLVTGLCVVQFNLYSYLWLTNWTPALWLSEFLNCLYNYRWNWTPCSPITIINQTMLCSPFLSYDFELNI